MTVIPSRFRQLGTALLGLLLLLAAPPLAAPVLAAEGGTLPLTLLFVARTGDPEGWEGQGGLARLATLLARERSGSRPTLLLHGGDVLSQGPLSAFDQGAHQIDLLNRLRVDVMGVQALDFNHGEDIISRRAQEAVFAVVASNVQDARSNQPLDGLERSVLLKAGGVAVGVVSLLGPEDLSRTTARDSRVLEPLEALRVQAAALRGRGARLVVALTSDRGDLDHAVAASGLADIVATVQRASEKPGSRQDGAVLTVVPGTAGTSVIAVDLEFRAGDAGPPRSAVRVLGTADLPPDPAMAALVDAYVQRLAPRRAAPVLALTAAADTRVGPIRQAENGLGNLVADTVRRTVRADVALINGGAFRSFRTYEAGTVLTRQDIMELLPFRNRILLLRVSGQQLRTALENGVSTLGLADPPDGRFPHVSNLRLRIDATRPPGQRVLAVSIGGEALENDRLYRLAVPDFLADGGDGYRMLADAPRLLGPAEADLLSTILMAEWGNLGHAAPEIDGRLQLEHAVP